MKQQLFIIASSGSATFYPTGEDPRRYSTPPFASFFEALWKILTTDYHVLHDSGAKITIYYGAFTYVWDKDAARQCFQDRLIDERTFADRTLLVSESSQKQQ